MTEKKPENSTGRGRIIRRSSCSIPLRRALKGAEVTCLGETLRNARPNPRFPSQIDHVQVQRNGSLQFERTGPDIGNQVADLKHLRIALFVAKRMMSWSVSQCAGVKVFALGSNRCRGTTKSATRRQSLIDGTALHKRFALGTARQKLFRSSLVNTTGIGVHGDLGPCGNGAHGRLGVEDRGHLEFLHSDAI